jgi:hypothetical protein
MRGGAAALHMAAAGSAVNEKKVNEATGGKAKSLKDANGNVDPSELADLLGKDENDLPGEWFDKQFDSENKPGSCGCKSSGEPFHVHFGLGRLGCGLVIPALQQKGIPFALVQRPSKQWGELVDEADKSSDEKVQLTFKVNGKNIADPLDIIADAKGLGDCGCVGDSSMVALSDDDELLQSLVKRATSFSSSLGPALTKVLPDLLNVLDDKPADERPILYACGKFLYSISLLHCIVCIHACRLCFEVCCKVFV